MTDVDIVYKVSKGKKVRVKSAAKEMRMTKKPPIVNQKRPTIPFFDIHWPDVCSHWYLFQIV
jgi:hypothetical protein